MKTRLAILMLSATLIALAAAGARRPNSFEPASDLPRGALVYVQIENLPEFTKAVSQSERFRRFAASQTLDDFSKSHLGIKLAKRLKEFSDTAGFGIDAGTLAKLADKRVALALYDIGRLDFAIVAPMTDGVFATTQLAANRAKFTEENLPGGGLLYRATVAADAGRQSQQLMFTHSRGRLVVATSDGLLIQTLVNIEGKRGRSALADEPSFKDLDSELKPRLASVWVDQAALNADFYFRQYWLMSGGKELENIRAGLFDLGFDDNAISERRVFLTDGTVRRRNIDSKAVAAAMRFVPADVPLLSIESADPATIDDAFTKTLFDRRKIAFGSASVPDGPIYGDKYDMAIDEEEPTETAPRPDEVQAISSLFAKARAVVSFSRPRTSDLPLFFETDRAVVLNLADADRFDRPAFEKLIAQRFATELLAGSDRFGWRTENAWRVIDLPFVGAGVRYRIDGANLIVTNGFDLVPGPNASIRDGEFSELTVVNLEQKDAAFDQIFAGFARRGADVGFFTGTVGELLESAAPVRRFEIRKRSAGKIIEETLVAEK